MDEQNKRITQDQMIAKVITARYSIDEQIALLRQKETKPEEYAAFYAFAEQVKAAVKEEYAAFGSGPLLISNQPVPGPLPGAEPVIQPIKGDNHRTGQDAPQGGILRADLPPEVAGQCGVIPYTQP